tara:strand:+ start:1606 stop:4533 length:2928 start_codon:yes stop_codon:yes gene_type:complete
MSYKSLYIYNKYKLLKDSSISIYITDKKMRNKLNFEWIKLIDNAKNPRPSSVGWSKTSKGKNPYNPATNYKGEPTVRNYGNITGIQNNIFVLDLDTNKWDPDNCKAIAENNGIHPFISKFGNEFGKDFNTYSVKTTSGGGHFYFKYDGDIAKNYQNKYHQIDIRSTGGYVVAPTSSVNGSSYDVVLDTTIKECPKKLKDWIIDQIINKNYSTNNKYKPTKKERKINKTIKNISKKYKHTPCDNRLWRYNISDAEILRIVADLPDDYINNYQDWLKLTTFFKILDKKNLWVQVCKSGENYSEGMNEVAWESCDEVNWEIVKHILITANADWVLPYIKYKPILKETEKPNTIIYRTKLGINESQKQECFFSNIEQNKFTVIKSDTGTGKTTAVKKYFKNKKFISIVSRRSLGMEQYRTFNEFGLDVQYYENFWEMPQDCNFITTIDSFFKCCSEIDFDEYYLFLDEFSSIVSYLIDASTPSITRKRTIYVQFALRAMTQCKKIIMADADINDNCFIFLRHITDDFLYIENTFIHNKNVKALEFSKEKEIIKRLKFLDKWLLCCDSKSLADNYFELLGDPTIKLYTSDNNEELDMDKHNKIIFSPKIIYGLDSSMPREVFCIYKEHTINPKKMLQQLSRCRNIIQLNYLFTKKKVMYPKYKNLDCCITRLMESNARSIKDFGFSTTDELNELYIHLLSRIEYNNDAYSTNKFAHFKLLLKKRGFIDITKYNKTDFDIKKHKEISKELKIKRSENFDPHTDQNIRINQYLGFPDDETIIKHKDLFLDTGILREHFRICDYFLKTREHNLEKLQTARDFNIKTLRSGQAQLYFLHKLYETFNKNHTDYTIRPDIITTTTDKQSKQINKGYELIFNTKLKKPYDLSSAYHCDRLINKIYTKLFRSVLEKKRGCSWVKDGKTKRGEKWIIQKEEINRNYEIYLYRNAEAKNPVLEFLPEDDETPKKKIKGTTQDEINNFFDI